MFDFVTNTTEGVIQGVYKLEQLECIKHLT